MILSAKDEFDLDLSESVLIGDKIRVNQCNSWIKNFNSTIFQIRNESIRGKSSASQSPWFTAR